RLSLISGRPLSFTMDMYEPLYVQRPVVVPDLYASLKPQVYGEAMGGREEKPQLKEGVLSETRARKAMRGDFADEKAEVALNKAFPAASAPADLELQQGVASIVQATELGEVFQYAIA